MRLGTIIVSATVATVVSCLPAAAANLLVNPGFELGTGTDADNWSEIEASGDPLNATPTTDRVGTNPHSGSFAMQLSYVNTATPGTGSNAEIQQLTALNSVVPGQSYDYSFYARRVGELGAGTVVFAEIQFLDSDGSNGGGVKGGSGLLQIQNGLTEAYTLFSFPGIVASADSDAALVMLRVSGGAVENSSATMLVDDMVFESPVPEPAALSLLGLGALALVRRRRA